MTVLEPQTWDLRAGDPRQFERTSIQCRARILIGTRQYAGHLQNICRGGAIVQ